MRFRDAPIQDAVISNTGRLTQTWVLFFVAIKKLLDNSQPQQVPAYTVADVPDATLYEGFVIYVSNEAGGKTLAFSDGAAWRRVQDRAVIS